jgi:hypothetical protein
MTFAKMSDIVMVCIGHDEKKHITFDDLWSGGGIDGLRESGWHPE